MPISTVTRTKSFQDHPEGKASVDDLLGHGVTFQDLILGAPFRTGGPENDGADLADWLLAHLVDRGLDHARLSDTLEKVRFLRASGLFLSAAQDCRKVALLHRPDAKAFSASAALFSFFGASLGNQEAARCVAAEAIALAEEEGVTEDEALAFRAAALGWLSYAAVDDTETIREPRSYAQAAAERCLDGMARAWQRKVGRSPPARGSTAFFNADDTTGLDYLLEAENEDEEPPTSGHIVVLRSIGGRETPEGARVAKAFGRLVGRSLPLVRTPDLGVVRAKLLSSYPHAHAAIDAVLAELVGREHVRLRPFVFVGPPGAGKTALCSSLLEALGLPGLLYSCGGVSDGSLGGNSRRWQTGEPCTPLSLMSARQVASPGIVLDELEKAGSSSHNGRLHDAILGMLEPSSAEHWHDPYLQAEVDLSHVVWLATANSTAELPAPLLDRCRLIRVPAPGPEHLAVLSTTLLRRAYEARGLDVRWARPLDGVETAAVASAWRGGSIRQLARMLEGVLAARDYAPVLQ